MCSLGRSEKCPGLSLFGFSSFLSFLNRPAKLKGKIDRKMNSLFFFFFFFCSFGFLLFFSLFLFFSSLFVCLFSPYHPIGLVSYLASFLIVFLSLGRNGVGQLISPLMLPTLISLTPVSMKDIPWFFF